MKLTKLLLEYPGALTPRPKEEWQRNQKQIQKRKEEQLKHWPEDNHTYRRIIRYLEDGGIGDLTLTFIGVDIPKELTHVKGNLRIGSYNNENLYPTEFEGTSLTVDKDFSLYNLTRLRELPNFLVVHGDLVVYGCDYIEKFPDYMFIDGDCFFMNTDFQYNFEIKGDITILGNLHISENDVWDKYSDAQIKDKMKVVGEIYDYD